MPRVVLLAICVVAAGCAVAPSTPHHAALAPESCSDLAQAREHSAAADNAEPGLQEMIFRDAYDDCMQREIKAANITTVSR